MYVLISSIPFSFSVTMEADILRKWIDLAVALIFRPEHDGKRLSDIHTSYIVRMAKRRLRALQLSSRLSFLSLLRLREF